MNEPGFITKLQRNEKDVSKKKSTKRNSTLGRFLGVKSLIIVVILLQILIAFFIINPIRLYGETIARQVINEINKQTFTNPNEIPIVDVVTDPEILRSQNAVMAEVYKDAKAGDYIVGYSDKMIIYRKDEKRIIYEGESPGAIISNTQQAIAANIIAAAREKEILTVDNSEIPQVSIVNNPDELRNLNSEFYLNVKENDLLGVFPTNQVILIYRPSLGEIVNYGGYQVVINP
ncbi:MAG TPA: hypothetical protein VGA67_05220 [Candidatus Dojkabacteria bacterium]|jgi:hypothetical protein